MIVLTRLDGREVAVNEDQLVFVEASPDTVLILAGGQRLIVRESLPEVIERIAAFRRRASPQLTWKEQEVARG